MAKKTKVEVKEEESIESIIKPPSMEKVIECAINHLSENMSAYFVVGYDAMDRETIFCDIKSAKDHAACVYLLEKLLMQLENIDEESNEEE
jgi:hypothetical protein